ncbi:MAG TPA: class D beta-lactamase, partial [Bacteroidota bacterium]|nr:class D beta-lactamase [Bacteroidota bacterium]
SQTDSADNFRKYFDQYHVSGSFVLYDLNRNTYTYSNKVQFSQEFIPASTYKICNSLIGLETGVIPDENYLMKWDGVKRQIPEWNRDHTMQSAFKYSVVWYYQELARRVGGAREKYWLDKARYGNADTSGGIDRFWLSGGLRITPQQQIDFLKRLYKNELPFSQRSMDIVKKIMIADQTPQYTLRAKSGWSEQDGLNIGWYVGYVQRGKDVYFFATCIQSPEAGDQFGPARIEITKEILKDLHIL